MKKQKVAYFRLRRQGKGYDYAKVSGGPGRTKNGFQEVIRFHQVTPVISREHNFISDRSGKKGTWTTYERGEPITEEEYSVAYATATKGDHDLIVDNKSMIGLLNVYRALSNLAKKGKLSEKEAQRMMKLIAKL